MTSQVFEIPAWLKNWQEKYASLLVDGLTDGPTYVRMTRKECPMLDVQLAFRPYVMRLTEDKIAFCGKLSVFPVKESIKAPPANVQTMVGWLSAAFPNLDFPKQSHQRVGTVVMTLADAPLNAKQAFMQHWAESDMVDKLLNWVEEVLSITVTDRKMAARALKEAYDHWLELAFLDGDGPVTGKVGTSPEVAHGENILPFVKKKLTEEAKPENGASE